MKIIVGSQALSYHKLSPRIPKDRDIWQDTAYAFLGNGDNKTIPLEILELVPTTDKYYATPDAIYTIKCSHAAWDIHWDKTISDIAYLKRRGCKLIPELYLALYNYWKTIHGDKSFLSLKKNKDDFFNDYVPYVYDHDLLHEIVAKPNKPMYNKCLKDNEQVLIDKVKFEKLPKEEQIQLFKEEICTIALERWLIPSNFRIPKVKAYRMALKKTITNLTKNWATLFILDNIEDFVRMGNSTWYNNFLTFINKETIMSNAIAKLKECADKLEMDDYEVKYSLLHDDSSADATFESLKEELGYKLIEREGGEGSGDSAHSVIELEGKLYRLDYGYASYDGYHIDDIWDWTEVKAVEKTVTVYE